MPDRAALIAAQALRVGKYMPGDGATGGVPEADRLIPVVKAALDTAGLTTADIDAAVFTGNPPSSRQKGFSSYIAARLGLDCKANLYEVSALGVTGGTAFDLAAAEIMLGRADYALVIGHCYQANEKPYVAMERGVTVVGDVDFQSPFGVTPIAWYAFDMARYMYETGATREAIASVAIKSRDYARHNPLAQYAAPLAMQDILAAALIVDPLGRWEVPSQADGAICLVLTGEQRAKEMRVPFATLAARGFGHDGRHQMGDQPHDMTDFPAARDAVSRCLGSADLSLHDISLFELYAPCTITEVLVSESLRLFERGGGAQAALDGTTGLGGTVPINTSGGCLARGHPPSLTGLYGVLECFEQVLGRAGGRQVDGAHSAVNLCEGGNYNLALAHLLTRGAS